jgi:hypothetical protein
MSATEAYKFTSVPIRALSCKEGSSVTDIVQPTLANSRIITPLAVARMDTVKALHGYLTGTKFFCQEVLNRRIFATNGERSATIRPKIGNIRLYAYEAA